MWSSRSAIVLPMTRTPCPPIPSMTIEVAPSPARAALIGATSLLALTRPGLAARRRAAGRCRDPGRCPLLGRPADDAELMRLERAGAGRGGPELPLVVHQHLVGRREADPPPVVLDALAGDVDEGEARPRDRLADRLAQGALVVH